MGLKVVDLEATPGGVIPGARKRQPRLPFYREHHLVAVGLFLVFVVARYIQLAARRDILATIRVEFIIGLITTFVCVALLMNRPIDLKPSKRVVLAICALFLVVLTQLPFAADREVAKDIFIDRVVKFAMMTFFMMVVIQSPRHLRFFMVAFLFSCFYITQEAVRGLVSGGLVWQNQGIMRLHGAVPIYKHPNSLAGLAIGTVPFIVFLFPLVRSWWPRAGLLALLATSSICILYSGSRTAYLAFLAFLIFWWATSKRKLQFLAIGVFIGGIGLAALPQEYLERFKSIGGQEAEGHSRQSRIQILKDARDILLENPAGIGVASFPIVRMKRFGRFQDTHNLYLEVATNLGFHGLIVFLFLVYTLLLSYRKAYFFFQKLRLQLRQGVKGLQLTPSLRRAVICQDKDLAFLSALCTGAAGFIFVRLVLGIFGMDLYEVYWWFGAGLAICLLNLAVSTGKNNAKILELSKEGASAGSLGERPGTLYTGT